MAQEVGFDLIETAGVASASREIITNIGRYSSLKSGGVFEVREVIDPIKGRGIELIGENPGAMFSTMAPVSPHFFDPPHPVWSIRGRGFPAIAATMDEVTIESGTKKVQVYKRILPDWGYAIELQEEPANFPRRTRITARKWVGPQVTRAADESL